MMCNENNKHTPHLALTDCREVQANKIRQQSRTTAPAVLLILSTLTLFQKKYSTKYSHNIQDTHSQLKTNVTICRNNIGNKSRCSQEVQAQL